jgi:hypothetical protein
MKAPVTSMPPNQLPTHRKLRVFAYDPNLATELENFDVSEVTINLPWENLEKGPVGEYLEVVDIDPPSGRAYEPVDLNAPKHLTDHGLAPSEGNPQFHQQMVYAVAMNTIHHFERALGRKVMWSDQQIHGNQWRMTERLRIYPHAMREENAYYDSEKKALLFGYFPAQPLLDGEMMRGGMVFTCLSHDIVAHETTHAVLDGINRYLMEPSNPDVWAFHEAFSDIVALFQHFTYPEVLRRQIAKARGDLTTETLLGQLAVQFGVGSGSRGALRDAIGGLNPKTKKWERRKPNPELLRNTGEEHDRGALLVAAVFDAFLAIYQQRTRDLLRIATDGKGILPPGDLHPDLVNRLANEAAKTAGHMLNMCIRAVDYVPPVDITFGDYLRAMVTADYDVVPDDDRNYRVALVEAFRKWGVYPREVKTLSVESLLWGQPDGDELKPFLFGLSMALNKKRVIWDELKSGVRKSLSPGYEANEILKPQDFWKNTQKLGEALHSAINGKAKHITNRLLAKPGEKEATLFGLNLYVGHKNNFRFRVENARPVMRVDAEGKVRSDLLIQIVQRRPGFLDPGAQAAENENYRNKQRDPMPVLAKCDFKFRGGASFIVDLETYQVRYAVSRSILDEERLERERVFRAEGRFKSERELYFGKTPAGQHLANLHGGHTH